MNQHRYQLGSKNAPETQPREKITPCSRGCCWTPYACAKQKTCACHTTGQNQQKGNTRV